jgi:hypothetical protein
MLEQKYKKIKGTLLSTYSLACSTTVNINHEKLQIIKVFQLITVL